MLSFINKISEMSLDHGVHTRTHPDGWIITGEIIKDYYIWVNYFDASHTIFGRVWGDFENDVYADSEDGFADFFLKHTPEPWDYADI